MERLFLFITCGFLFFQFSSATNGKETYFSFSMWTDNFQNVVIDSIVYVLGAAILFSAYLKDNRKLKKECSISEAILGKKGYFFMIGKFYEYNR